MRSVAIGSLLILLALVQPAVRGAESADADLPWEVARLVRHARLTEEQQTAFQRLRDEYQPRLTEARGRVAAHKLVRWRLTVIEQEFAERAERLLTPEVVQAQLIEILKQPTTIEFVETPLKDVVDYLKDLHHPLSLRIDRGGLRKAGKDAEIALTACLRGLSLQSALRLLLRQVGLMHVLHGNVVLITTEDEGRRLLKEDAVDPAKLVSANEVAMKKLVEALRKPIDAEFVETPLRDVVEYLKDYCRVKHSCSVEIQLDVRALDAAGAPYDAPCTWRFQGASLESVLKQVLGKLNLKYAVQDEVILITADAARRPLRPADNTNRPARLPHADERAIVDYLDATDANVTLNEQGRVTSLVFGSARDGNAVLRLAGQLPELTSLTLAVHEPRWPRITAAGLANLRNASQLTGLELHGEKIDDQGLASLAGLKHLRSLNLAYTDITDAGLKHLAKLAYLKELVLTGTRIDGSGLADLPDLDDLETLKLNDTQVNDTHLVAIGRHSHLRWLDLSGTPIDGTRLESLAALGNLENLSLESTQVTDAALHNLQRVVSLGSLNLNDTAITNAGLGELASLENLSDLKLDGTRVTDAGLTKLRSLPKLEYLSLAGTGITDAGLALIEELPNLSWVHLDKSRVSQAAMKRFKRELTERNRKKSKEKGHETNPFAE